MGIGIHKNIFLHNKQTFKTKSCYDEEFHSDTLWNNALRDVHIFSDGMEQCMPKGTSRLKQEQKCLTKTIKV